MNIVIIGAGLAGITAARELCTIDGLNVKVLEARDRIGGRICSVSHHFNGTPIDLGASWIHGMNDNPLTEIAKSLKLKIDITDNPNLTSGDDFEIYDSNGKLINKDFQEKLRNKFDTMISSGRKVLEQYSNDLSIEEMFQETSKLFNHDFTPEEKEFIDWLKAGMEGWDNTNLSDLSARNHFWEHDSPLYSGGDGFIADGFYSIINHLAKEIEDKILLSHEVQRIEYNSEIVRLYTNRGIFEADYVISTLPLGVLKAKVITFEPPLPPWKEEAIEKIGFGLMNKIIMEFPVIFWNSKIEGLGYVSKEYRGEFGFFVSLHQLIKKPVLMCFVAADFAKKVEKWTDKQIIDRVMEILTQIYGVDIPRPIYYSISRWGSDPYSRGSYSFMKIHSTTKHLENLGNPVGRIHFAGEATTKYPGYTHGALQSAKREVERIRKRTNKSIVFSTNESNTQISTNHLVPVHTNNIRSKL